MVGSSRSAEEAAAPRVLMLTPRTFPQSPVVKRNVDYLLACGVRVDLIHVAPTAGAWWEPPSHAGLRRFQVPVRHRRSRAAWYLLEYATFFAMSLGVASALAARHRYDSVHVDNLPDSVVFAALLARTRGARLVLNIADPMPELTASRLGIGSRHPAVAAARWIERASTAYADAVLVPNQPCRELVIARGTDPEKVHVLPNTLPVEPVAPQPRPGPATAVCLGTLLPRYGVQIAIDAIRLLRDRRPELTLRVIGTGEQEPELRRQVRRLGLEDRVHFLGFLPWPEAMEELRAASVGLVPLLADGFGELMTPTKLFDYVQQGVPAVCSRLPGIQGFFPEDSVSYVDAGSAPALAEAIAGVLDDPTAATAMAGRAQSAIADAAWERAGPRYLDLLGLAHRPAPTLSIEPGEIAP